MGLCGVTDDKWKNSNHTTRRTGPTNHPLTCLLVISCQRKKKYFYFYFFIIHAELKNKSLRHDKERVSSVCSRQRPVHSLEDAWPHGLGVPEGVGGHNV